MHCRRDEDEDEDKEDKEVDGMARKYLRGRGKNMYGLMHGVGRASELASHRRRNLEQQQN